MAKQSSAGSPGAQDQVIHEYDGVQEYDNDLPNWWLATFVVTVVFAAGYWLYYEGFRVAPGPRGSFDSDQTALAAAAASKQKSVGEATNEGLVKLSSESATLATGKEAFVATCAQCHRADGGGNIGPNLTDNAWLHGGAPVEIYKTVRDGFVEKGMPPWGPVLGEDKTRAVVAYLLSIRNTNVADGKPPAGTVVAP